jgi:DNA-binding MarR family transcriptional regulator
MSERLSIEELLRALKPFDGLRGWVPIRYVTTFLMVALDEGKGPSAYARSAGVDRMSMSRCLRDMGERSRTGGPGLGLVRAVRDPSNARRRKVLLTEKGRALLLHVRRSLTIIEPDQEDVPRLPDYH